VLVFIFGFYPNILIYQRRKQGRFASDFALLYFERNRSALRRSYLRFFENTDNSQRHYQNWQFALIVLMVRYTLRVDDPVISKTNIYSYIKTHVLNNPLDTTEDLVPTAKYLNELVCQDVRCLEHSGGKTPFEGIRFSDWDKNGRRPSTAEKYKLRIVG